MNQLATAYHEAGHVAVAHHFGIKILRKGVSIKPDETSGGRAHTLYALGGHPDWDNSPQMRFRAEKRVLVSLAGIEAQRRHNPRSVRHYHSSADYRNAVDVMEYFVGSNEELEAYLNLLCIRARQIVALPLVWAKIERVANALLERKELTAAEIRDLLQK